MTRRVRVTADPLGILVLAILATALLALALLSLGFVDDLREAAVWACGACCLVPIGLLLSGVAMVLATHKASP